MAARTVGTIPAGPNAVVIPDASMTSRTWPWARATTSRTFSSARRVKSCRRTEAAVVSRKVIAPASSTTVVDRVRCRSDELQYVVAQPPAVGEEQRRVKPVHDHSRSRDDPVKTLYVPKRIIVGDVPEHRPMRQGGVVDESHQRDSDGNEQALEDTEGQHADKRNDAP